MKHTNIKEQLHVNLIVNHFCVDNIPDKICSITSECSKVVFNFDFDKYFIHFFNDVVEYRGIPYTLLHMKKFIRKMTYFSFCEMFIFIPRDENIENVRIIRS